jgi:hypothetical protein
MSTGSNTSVRWHVTPNCDTLIAGGRHSECQYRENDRSEPVASSDLPKSSLFPDEFFNNIGQKQKFVAYLKISSKRPINYRYSPEEKLGELHKNAVAVSSRLGCTRCVRVLNPVDGFPVVAS